jgi:nitroreductase
MSKQAKTKYGIHFLLESRWSPRSFRDDGVEKEKLQRIFEAAQWAPSSMNEQPWKFIVGEKGTDSYNKIFESLLDMNKRWAKNAPVLIVSLAKKNFTRDGRENFHFLYDTGQAVANLVFQATHEGLYTHQMGGFNFEVLKYNFTIPEEFYIVTVIAVGYLGKPEILDDDLKSRELADRERKDIGEIFYVDRFGNSWK